MNRRLILNSVFISVIPVVTTLCVAAFSGENQTTGFAIAAIGFLLQIPVVFLCKRNVRMIFQPSEAILSRMGIKSVTCPYEPGRFSPDFKVTGFMLWLSAIAPFMTCIGIAFTEMHTVTILNFATYEGPNMPLLILSVFFLMFGMVALPLWVKFGQAMIIYNEVSERRRYLYMGYAEVVEDGKYFKTYITMVKAADDKNRK